MNLPIETRATDLKISIGRNRGLALGAASVSAPMEAGTKLATPFRAAAGLTRARREAWKVVYRVAA